MPNSFSNLNQTIAGASPAQRARRKTPATTSALYTENLSLGITLGTCEGSPLFQFNEDRFRHTAIVGRTGSGKSNLVLQMEREDIRSGVGVAIVAAHEEDAIYPLMCVPDERVDDVVIIDPTNTRLLPNMNPLDVDRTDRAAASKAVSDCIELLKSQSHYEWAGPRFDQMARLGLETMLDPGFPTRPSDGFTYEPHIGLVERMFTSWEYVESFLEKLESEHLREQWKLETRTRMSREADDKVQWFLSKLDPFSSDRVLRNIFGPGKKTVDVKRIVDEGKILVAVIPEHRIGHDAADLLRTWLFMQLKDAILQRGAGSRPDARPVAGAAAADARPGAAVANATTARSYYGICANAHERVHLDPFFVYVDELAEHATPDFAAFLSESRKYCVGFTLAFQNLSQMRLFDVRTGYENDKLLGAILGNVGTTICFPVGSPDVPAMACQLGVPPHEVAAIRRYRPIARVSLDNEAHLAVLDVPPKPEPDDPQMPETLAENQIVTNTWLPVRKDR